MSETPPGVRLLLLRHGEVASHRGDVPVTDAGLATARDVGKALGAAHRSLSLLSGNTRRAKDTAAAVAEGARAAGADVDGPHEAFALRNPDIYLAGQRVDMVGAVAAFAAQVPGLTEEQAGRTPFVTGFLGSPERIGWWLRHPDPPGDDAATVRRRIADFARSLLDLGAATPAVTVAVTHSPVIRACALGAEGEFGGEDPGEPPWLGGVAVDVLPEAGGAGRTVRMRWAGVPSRSQQGGPAVTRWQQGHPAGVAEPDDRAVPDDRATTG